MHERMVIHPRTREFVDTVHRIQPVTTAAIIGAGELGGAIAHALAAREAVGRICADRCRRQSRRRKGARHSADGRDPGFATQLRGSSDITDAIGASVCLVADRFGAPFVEWAGEDGYAMLERTRPRLY